MGVIGYNVSRKIYRLLMSGENKKRKSIMKIYMDNCCYNRPYDDQTHIRIYLETEAKLAYSGYGKKVQYQPCNLFYAGI